MSVKDIIFVVLAACLMCYLHRRDMLGRAAAELGTVVSVLAVWLVFLYEWYLHDVGNLPAALQ